MQVSLRRNGFTLVELLTVIAIISVLAALLFPVFLTVRGKAREISCIANMHQVGLSLKMYTQDYDEMYPWAVDPTDKYTPQIWNQYPQFKEQIEFMPMQHEALQPYVKSAESFHCPSDAGYQVEDFTGEELDASPSSFAKFGTSLNYRTEISFRQATEGTIRNPSELNVFMDAAGKWHGGFLLNLLRYNVLFADGHVKNLDRQKLDAFWQMPI